MPASTFTANSPLKPGGRFSFSPTMRSPLSSSTSLTAVASVLVILKVIAPAGNVDRSAAHPFAAVIVTAASRGFPSADAAGRRRGALPAAGTGAGGE